MPLLIGDFTGWLAREKGYMKVTPDGERYWIEIKGLKPGKEYRFQYLVDSALFIADPYADKILDPSNDQYIANFHISESDQVSKGYNIRYSFGPSDSTDTI